MDDLELKAMNTVYGALASLEQNKDALERILGWASQRFLGAPVKPQIRKSESEPPEEDDSSTGIDYKRLAHVDGSNQFHLTVRDLKETSKIDSVKRLIYLSVLLHQKLTKSETTSRKTIVKPILEKWRVYDANARRFMALDKGLMKSGDEFKLDVHATEEAETFCREILEAGVKKEKSASRHLN